MQLLGTRTVGERIEFGNEHNDVHFIGLNALIENSELIATAENADALAMPKRHRVNGVDFPINWEALPRSSVRVRDIASHGRGR